MTFLFVSTFNSTCLLRRQKGICCCKCSRFGFRVQGLGSDVASVVGAVHLHARKMYVNEAWLILYIFLQVL
jgi:hypothetical protein